jgi:hypothetical protein
MHLRRALLLFALVLGLTALATAVAPAPKSQDEAPATPPSQEAPVAPPTTVTLSAPAGAPRAWPVRHDARVVVQVTAGEGGQVEIPKLGQVAAVGPDDTTEFDLLDLGAGRYDVLFEPALGTPTRIGTLVSR